MYKEILRSIEGIEVWPVISLVIFFLFFTSTIWWLVTVDKGFIEEMKQKPLNDGLIKNKFLIAFVGFVGLPFLTSAQDSSGIFGNPVDLWLFVITIFILVLLVLVAVLAYSVMNFLIGDAFKEGKVDYPDAWTWMMHKLTMAAPVEEEGSLLLDHNYDGIQELDNHLPPWWLWSFYGSIVFGVLYVLLRFVFPVFPLQDEEYRAEMVQAEAMLEEVRLLANNSINEENVEFSDDPAIMASGEEIYIKNCAACHLVDGGGSVGPNLTDQYWIHGGSMKDIFSTIKYGVQEKGMISWQKQLNPAMMRDVSSYILAMQGTTPQNPKDAQGELYVPSDEPATEEEGAQ